MAKQTFTTGQVLTAAQMTSLQQTALGGGSPVQKTASYVLTAADAGTTIQMNSASSTTITVNTALFAAGDSVFIQNIGTGVTTITAGTATVTTAGSLALTQWEGGTLYFTSSSAAIFFDYIQSSSTASNWSLLNAGGTALTGAQTITVSGISGQDKIMVLVDSASSVNASSLISVRLNTDTGNNYYVYGTTMLWAATYAATNQYSIAGAGAQIRLSWMSANAGSNVSGYVLLSGCNSSGVKVYNSAAGSTASTSNGQENYVIGGYYNSSSTISSVSVFSSNGNFDGGTVYVYASA